ncbi:Crp/Fnr family transcriptional regulator [Marivita sp. S6314]|uniref:Crp/Fnr family transcriptional regulator n=1 Tax=Marivita sp. S6314 TaxID=2926406 RepID=UPI001FF2F496|nr:Crp/Fnr family transcriptional regulator [Marivita sp. S6314]MCK0148464.1 Crp/Fnr family transcriptional regulator [Marivita sp. S6314]
MDVRTFLTQSPDLSDMACADEFASCWRRKRVSKGAHLSRQEQPETREFILLEGCLASSICDKDGKDVCVGFYMGPCVVTPNIARTRDGLSLVSIAATTDATLAWMDSELLSDLMLSSEPIRNWANAILRDALSKKAEREWCLAALGGAERLNWFRQSFPGYEDIFTHALIASFLGVTPVTMSRLRAVDRNR